MEEVSRIAYGVKRLLNVEYKSKLSTTTIASGTTAIVTNLTAIAQGDDFLNRQGRKIRLQSVSMKGVFTASASATITFGRVIIFRDNNGSTTKPVLTDLFADDSTFYTGKHKLGDPQTNGTFIVQGF